MSALFASWDDELRRLYAALELRSTTEFALGGRTFCVSTNPTESAVEAPANPAIPIEVTAGPLVERLADVFYRYVYSHAFTGQLESADADAESGQPWWQADADLLAQLTEANATEERWEHGWQVAQRLSDGRIQARRGNLRRLVWPGQFLSLDGPGARLRTGSQISLFYAKESVTLQPGFYYLFGETAEEQSHAYGTMRLYFNVKSTGAPQLVRALSHSLNRFQVPFRMKCAVALGEYTRTDVAVLYMPKRFTSFVFQLLPEIYPPIREHLEPAIPFFARRLRPGLALAEDPGTGESFGQHRCQLLAQAAWNTFEKSGMQNLKQGGVEEWLEELALLFHQHGVDPASPHMNGSSLDFYQVPEALHEHDS